METVNDRLRELIEARPPKGRRRGVRLFQAEMAAAAKELGRNVIGLSLPTIYGYLREEGPRPRPPEEFLRLAADVLEVRHEWLLTGEGGRTHEEERARTEAAKIVAGPGYTSEPIRARTWDGVIRERLYIASRLPDWTWSVMKETVQRLMNDKLFQYPPDVASRPEVQLREEIIAAWEIAHALSTPLDHAPVPVETRSEEELADYVTSMCQGLMRLIPTLNERIAMGMKAARRGESQEE